MLASALAVGADEVGVAEAAERGGAVLLTAVPEVAAGKAHEHRRTACAGAFALQREEELFDGIGHRGGRGVMPRHGNVECLRSGNGLQLS